MKKFRQIPLLVICLIVCCQNTALMAQENTLPYAEIPDAPKKYNACTVAARMIDGLGFRYYWATEGLRSEDLNYKPSESARTADATLDHIYGLTMVITNSVKGLPNIRPMTDIPTDYEEKRRRTLLALKEASDILRASKPRKMKDFKVVFQRGDNKTEYPFWNQLNGPIADAIWHVGQMVSFRRASGNPLNPKVSVFSGKLRN
ncbi:MAG: hypothetical protein KTR30_14385 [Saprospiraceae bacterium]|nr:hypothetical protein [Saprospiraceae bacterium]